VRAVISVVVYAAPFLLIPAALGMGIAAFVHMRRSRTAPYFTIRKRSTILGLRLTGLTIVCIAASVGVLSLRGRIDPPHLRELFARKTQEETDLPIGIDTPAPGDNQSETTNELPPTITPTLATPTADESEEEPDLSATPETEDVPSDARIRIAEISMGISASLEPVDTGTQFDAGIPRVYYWLEYDNMENGLEWTQVLLLNGEQVLRETTLWDQDEEGLAYYFFDAEGGWPAGSYEVQFYIGDELVDTRRYTLQ